jgi:hypothetical protein
VSSVLGLLPAPYSAAYSASKHPAVVATVVVRAAQARSPRLRYAAGPLARRVSLLRRLGPARAVARQIRKLNGL